LGIGVGSSFCFFDASGGTHDKRRARWGGGLFAQLYNRIELVFGVV